VIYSMWNTIYVAVLRLQCWKLRRDTRRMVRRMADGLHISEGEMWRIIQQGDWS